MLACVDHLKVHAARAGFGGHVAPRDRSRVHGKMREHILVGNWYAAHTSKYDELGGLSLAGALGMTQERVDAGLASVDNFRGGAYAAKRSHEFSVPPAALWDIPRCVEHGQGMQTGGQMAGQAASS